MSDCDRIRQRPGMYVGDVHDGSGLLNMVLALANNAINEAHAGFGDRIEIVLEQDGSCTVRDRGRGIPVEPHPIIGISAAELIMTRLASVKFHKDLSQKSLHDIGAAVVNALSSRMDIHIWRNQTEFFARFRNGEVQAPVRAAGQTEAKRGTEINFAPSSDVFFNTRFDFAALTNHFHKTERPGGHITLLLADQRENPEQAVYFTL